jgi:membrane protease subunit HflK
VIVSDPIKPQPPGPEPLSVRLIHAARDWCAGHLMIVIAAVVGVVLAAWLVTGIYTVPNGSSAAVQRFGRLVDDAVPPGLHFSLPGGIDRVTRIQTGDVFRAEIGGDHTRYLSLLTGDENLIEATLVVQFRISDLGDSLFAVQDPTELLRQAVLAALVEVAAKMSVEEVLTTGKAAVQNNVRSDAQALLDRYGSGITLVAVNLQSVDPPLEAAQAFREVSDARAQAAQSVNNAEGRRGRLRRIARGDASKITQEARAAAETRIQQARGAAGRFSELLEHSRVAPGQTRDELYFRIMKDVLPRARILVVPPGEGARIDLQLIPRGQTPPDSARSLQGSLTPSYPPVVEIPD